MERCPSRRTRTDRTTWRTFRPNDIGGSVVSDVAYAGSTLRWLPPDRSRVPVSDMASDDVVTANRDSAVGDIAEQLKSENVGAVVIADEEKPVGIVTDRDIVVAFTEHDDLRSLTADDVMTEDPATLEADEEGIEISRAIGERGVRRLPVVGDDGTVVGIVTLDDLVATIGEQLGNVADTIESQSPDYSP